jgi:hypothetical protein
MTIQGALAILCVELLLAPEPYMLAQQQSPPNQQSQADGSQNQPPALTPDQLDSLVAPLALYPDPILSQVLVASTYPLEIVQAARWLSQNPTLQGKAIVDAAAKQTWDASVQALVVLPDLLKSLNQNITWTSDLGNAFLAQEQGVMDAVQRMRQKAQSNGALQSTKEQQVTTTTQGGNTYIEIQPASPDVVYIPQYDPVAVWGPPPVYYPYPPIYYPAATAAIAFGVGVAVGAIWGGGWGGWSGWGWGAGWGRNNVVINNNFISRNNFNRVNVGNGNSWVHNPAHRGAVPYANRNVANQFNSARGNVNVNARPTTGQVQQRLNQGNIGQRPGNGPRPGQGNLGGNVRPGQGNAGQAGNAFRPSQGQIGQGNARPSQGQIGPGSARPAGGGDRVGNRSVGGGSGANRGASAFGGMSQGGSRAQMNSSRGAASGGFRGGGGARGGGRRR